MIPQGIRAIEKRVPEILEDGENGLPGLMRQLTDGLSENFKEMDRQVDELEAQSRLWHRENEVSLRLAEIPGVGPITASGMVATLGNAREFKNGRQLAAWLGLVPRQYSSGGKQNLLGISKRGNTYLRTMFIHSARAVKGSGQRKAGSASWLSNLIARRHKNIPSVALANKNARIIWALLTRGKTFRADYTTAAAAA